MKPNQICWLVSTLIWVLVNLPLFYVLKTQSELEVILSVVGHSPNQFLFLFFIFPFAILATVRTYQTTAKLVGQLAEQNISSGFVSFFKYKVIFIIALLLGALVTYADSKSTPTDFYQWPSEEVSTAAKLNKNFIIAWHQKSKNDKNSKAESKEDPKSSSTKQPSYEQKRALMKAMYAKHNGPGIGNEVILWFEAIELGVVLFIVANFMILTYVNLRLNGIIRRLPKSDTRDFGLKALNDTVKYGIVFLSAVLFWPPLRLYNIEEIIAVTQEPYTTVAPVAGYLFAALLVIALLWIYYSRVSSALWEKLLALMPLVFTGGLLGLTKTDPRLMVYIIGSGIEVVNVIVLLVFIGFAILFSAEIWRQLSASDGGDNSN